MIKNIIFDFGGVLGTNADYEFFYEILDENGISREKAIEIWRVHWPEMKMGRERVEKIWETIQNHTTTNVSGIISKYNDSISTDEKMLDLCRKLKNNGYKLAILANETYDWMNIKRQKGNLEEIFDVIYASADIKVAKPQPESYLKTLESLKAKTEETLFIDDMTRNTEAAEKLGIKSILFRDIRQLKKELSNFEVTF